MPHAYRGCAPESHVLRGSLETDIDIDEFAVGAQYRDGVLTPSLTLSLSKKSTAACKRIEIH